MSQQYVYETVSEAISGLSKRGYITDFSVFAEKECLVCNKTSMQLLPGEFEIDEVYRFEGDTDPGDEMILFAISSTKHKMKGILLNAYGVFANDFDSKIVERLKNHL